MIISMKNSNINNKIIKHLMLSDGDLNVQPYHKISLDIMQGHQVFIVDLELDGNFIKFANAQAMTNKLIQAQLPKGVEVIYLLINDIDPKKSLYVFANQLAHNLNQLGYSLNVNIISNINYDFTYIQFDNNYFQLCHIAAKDRVKLLKQLEESKTVVDVYKHFDSKVTIEISDDFITWLEKNTTPLDGK
ncbi:MAG: hypothetical protein EP298_04085 [Gammaproteobacteria bacterium]|nr:MAG: hypothetical protein EP298_04085 [Gammaproteobacteria bacterium]UTW43810.1 hypothetical protein KFE69_06895 [bacterium SCSIO 12844]